MRVQKIYLETSVFIFYFADDAPDKREDTVCLFEEIKQGKYEPYTSEFVVGKLQRDSGPKRDMMIDLVTQYDMIVLPADEETRRLANIYVVEKIIHEKCSTDALHIASTTVNDLDFIMSYNFQHIVKLKTITMTEIVNLREKYRKMAYIHQLRWLTMRTEPKAMKEIHDIRQKIREETKNMTPEEEVSFYNNAYAKLRIDAAYSSGVRSIFRLGK